MAKLTYRGHSYESNSPSIPIESAPITLSYRGVKFQYQPASAPLIAENQRLQTNVNLVYRGHSTQLSQSEVNVKYRGAESVMPLFSIFVPNINKGLTYRGATY
jgi:hypothetical protein